MNLIGVWAWVHIYVSAYMCVCVYIYMCVCVCTIETVYSALVQELAENRTPAIYTSLRNQSFPLYVLSDTNRYVIC
jgi:hypothetical protein